MKFLFVSAILLPSLASAAVLPRAAEVDYDGWKVYRVDTENGVDAVRDALSQLDISDAWNRDVSTHMDVAVKPDQLDLFESLGLKTEVMHSDLGAAVKKEKNMKKLKKGKNEELPSTEWFDSYHSYDDHLEFLHEVQKAFKKNSKIFTVGKTYEGRDIYGIHIWGNGKPGERPAVVWHGTVHAREWITTMTVEYLLYQLVDGYKKKDATVMQYLNKNDFYIMPVVNPDGFIYTQTVERLWRKNRQPPPPTTNSTCYGTDINRNWPFQWDANPAGASTDPCSLAYKGPSPGNTPENQALTKHILSFSQGKKPQGIKLYIDWHSYSQLLLSPYGYSCTALPPNNLEHQTLMTGAAAALAIPYGTVFRFGPTCSTIYPATGGSLDYVYAVGKSQFSFAVELRDRGQFGFVLPPEQIKPSGVETWEGIKSILSNM